MVHTTRVERFIRARRPAVYRALVDPAAIGRWRVPAGMTCTVHAFEPWPGGAVRVSLTYDAPDSAGKSARHTDTYRGRFGTLVPDERVVEVIEFETGDPALRGAMTLTTTLADAAGGTTVTVLHEGVPDAVPAVENEAGTRAALDNLARLVEAPEWPHS